MRDSIRDILQSADSIRAPCPHFDQGCTGCTLQDKSYTDQIKAKELYLEQQYGQQVRVIANPDEFGCMNRMDFLIAEDRKGLMHRSLHGVVDVQTCLLLPEPVQGIWTAVRDVLQDVPEYESAGEGFLRRLTIRLASGGRMLIATTTTPCEKERHEAFQHLLERLLRETELTSVHWTVNDSHVDEIVGERFWFAGEEWITDEIGGKPFRIYPETQFYGNSRLAGAMIAKAAAFANAEVLDLYSGVGVLSIFSAHQQDVSTVTGVDDLPACIEAARENAILNEIPTNECRFVKEDVTKYLEEYDWKAETVICDPPGGLDAQACESLLRGNPHRIIYISRDVKSHVLDLQMLKKGYNILLIEAYDSYPQTSRIEVLSVLESSRNGRQSSGL